MNEMKADYCLVFLSDVAFSVLAEISINNELKSELLKRALPQGSKWKMYAGMRSISFFPLESLPELQALSYSIATDSIVTPIVSFIIILNRYESEKIISRQMSGIENAFLRRIDTFASLDSKNTELLRTSLIYYKTLEQSVSAKEPRKTNESRQTIFSAIYNNQQQWKVVESRVLEKSAKSLLTFRTFALQKEAGFQVLGLVSSVDSNKRTKEQGNPASTIVVLLLLLLLLLVLAAIILLLFLFYAQRAPQ